jgi:hypothetical protein
MKILSRSILITFALLIAGGCATIPNGPSVMVLPPPGKPFDQFQADDIACRQWSRQQIGLTPQETVNKNTATGAAIGTVVGAGLGAAIGSASGNAGAGAAIGAASGLLVGTATGADSGQVYGWEAQRRYDIAYQQCMYANGNLIPGMRRFHHVLMTPPPPPPTGTETTPPDFYQPQNAPPPPPPPPFQPVP